MVYGLWISCMFVTLHRPLAICLCDMFWLYGNVLKFGGAHFVVSKMLTLAAAYYHACLRALSFNAKVFACTVEWSSSEDLYWDFCNFITRSAGNSTAMCAGVTILCRGVKRNSATRDRYFYWCAVFNNMLGCSPYPCRSRFLCTRRVACAEVGYLSAALFFVFCILHR